MKIGASSSLRERLDMLLGFFIQIGDGQFGPERAKRLGATPGDRLIVGDADDQALAALERDLGLRIDGIVMILSRCFWELA